MTEPTALELPTSAADGSANRGDDWNLPLDRLECEQCHWSYLTPAGQAPAECPHCFHTPLVNRSESSASAADPKQPPATPELVLPFSLSEEALNQAIRQFAARIPYPPADLRSETLRERLTAVYLPMWLVDAHVTAQWQAEAGFDYRTLSHQEQYSQNRGHWTTHEVEEQHTRWGNRVGRLKRPYQNIPVPALEDAAQIEKQIGGFSLELAQHYTPDCLTPAQVQTPACVRLPDHQPKDAWSEAAAAFQKAAAAECQLACAADHLRQFRWKAQFTHLNWTLLLQPIYTTYYLDDSGKSQPVIIHGQTGRTSGQRRSSMDRALEMTVKLLVGGLVFFLLGVLLDRVFPDVALAGILSFVTTLAGIFGVVGMLIPVVTAWDFNRNQILDESNHQHNRSS